MFPASWFKPDKRVNRLDDASSFPSPDSFLSYKKQYVGIMTERDILYR